ncbi:winged helix-turn-helix domain-containing protein [Micromonospora rifamycinica]|uniref:winged helix-turn-helix domain-containing protein n=1 Tax=Micromonospora rifamycinica TaxID=291594 RepID=UPI0033CFE8EB
MPTAASTASRGPVTALDQWRRRSVYQYTPHHHISRITTSEEDTMDSEPEQTATPSALDRVAAALTALGQDSAAAIAERAGVGYSTATKRLRLLEEAGQAETFRADDGRTLWRQPTNPSTRHDDGDPSASTTATDHPEPDYPCEPSPPQEQFASTVVEEGPGDEATSGPPDGVFSPTTHAEADQPPSQDAPTRSDTGDSEHPYTPTHDDTPAGTGEGTAGSADETKFGQVLDPVGSDDSGVAGGLGEAASATAGGKQRRSKGSLRGAIRDVLEAHPGQALRTSQLCRAVDEANAGSGAAKASAGAVVNAVHKLVVDGLAVQVVERPAAFQLAPHPDR